MIPIGKIGRPFGIEGAVWLHLINADSETLRPGLRLELRFPKAPAQQVVVEDILPNGSVFLDPIADRTAAEKLVGAEVFVAKTDLPPHGENEVYLVDMLGYEVLSPTGENLGTVTGFSSNGPQALLVLEHADGRKGEVPFVPAFIVRLNHEQHQIVMNIPEGLIE